MLNGLISCREARRIAFRIWFYIILLIDQNRGSEPEEHLIDSAELNRGEVDTPKRNLTLATINIVKLETSYSS